jgi:hypothetical protein
LNLKTLVPVRAEAYPDQDLFQSLLQQRLVSRDFGENASSRVGNRAAANSQLRSARSAASSSPLLNRNQTAARKVSKSIIQALANQSNKSGPIKNLYEEASTPPRALDPDPVKSEAPEVTRNLPGKAARMLKEDLQTANPATLPNTEMPPMLRALIDFLSQEPGQALKVPTNRLPEVQSFLIQAGLPPEQVERLLTSPALQEQGLTAQNLLAAWQNAVSNTLKETLTANGSQIAANLGNQGLKQVVENATQIVSLQKLTKQADYQQMWRGLTLPKQDLAMLRTELQKLGVPAEAMTDLTGQNFPNGVPLAKVWQYLQQAPKSPPAVVAGDPLNAAKGADSMPLLSGDKDLAAWRQLLMNAGMDPDLAQTLTGGPPPATQEELRNDLAQLAPPGVTPQEPEAPKPLYLPQNMRVRQIPPMQPATPGQGQGSQGNFAQDFSFAAKAQEANIPTTANITENLNNFLAMLSGGGLHPGQAASPGVSGNNQAPVVSPFLSPEAKEAIWSQVQSGIMGNLRPGENQITLTLNPPDLGKLHLTLNLKGETVEVMAVTTHPAVAEAAATGVQQLAQALSQQGLTLTHFNFHHQDEAPQGQAQLAFFQNSGGQQKQEGQKEPDKWENPAAPRRRANGSIDCFA